MTGPPDVAGFVLAGGASTRMGRNKALLELEGQTLVARALESLKKVCSDVAIAGGTEELARFGRLVPDRRQGCGPLSGIVAGLAASSCDWNLFLAVDVPFVPRVVWERILDRADSKDRAGVAVMARVCGQIQPLCAAYARRGLDALEEELAAGHWKLAQAACSAGRVDFVDFADGEERWFRNYNTPEQFSALEG